ncbi:MAG: TonB-dependent receptor [Bacteroidota bacterium]
MKQILIIAVFFLIIALPASAQDHDVKGVIYSDEEAVELANIQLKAENVLKNTTSDEDGNFYFTDIPKGSYTLKVSRIGFKGYQQTVEVGESTSIVKIELAEDRLNLEEVVVSATRYELSREDAPVVVNVLSPKIFNASQSLALSEGLSFQSGVRVETNCQNCGFTQVRINGLEGAYSQILINSRAVFSALNSVYGLDQIPTNIIDRVEVVRSGGSALYGSNAIAGTINVITKEPIENNWQIGHNFGLIDGEAIDNTTNFNASLVSDDLNAGVTFYGFVRNREEYDANGDGFTELINLENNVFGAKAFFKPDEYKKITLDLSAVREFRRGGDRLELPPHFTDITEQLDHNTFIGGITYDQFSKDYKSKYSVYFSGQGTQRDSFYGGLGGERTPEDSLLAINAYGNTEDLALVSGFQFSRTLSNNDVLTLGVEHQFSDVVDDIPGYNRIVDQQVNSIGLYGQYEWQLDPKLKALLGARFDYTNVDGFYQIGDIQRFSDVETNVLSPRVTLLYQPKENVQVRGGYARGFRAPQAFNEDLHISSVGGEPLFVILSNDLDTEFSDAFTGSVNVSNTFGSWQTSFLVEGFYTSLRDPFTQVSTGAPLPNGSILEEVRNGEGAFVTGTNFEFTGSPSDQWFFQLGGTIQTTQFREDQVLFEPETNAERETDVIVDEFVRTPNVYGYFSANWTPTEKFGVDATGVYTGSMIVPRVVSESGFLDLVDTDPFFELNLKLRYNFKVKDHFTIQLNGGVQNLFNSYQNDFDSGPTRDSDFIFGPARPRTYFVGIKIGDFYE